MTYSQHRLFTRVVPSVATILLALMSTWTLQAEEKTKRFGIDEANLVLAPYVWKCSASGPESRAEATMPGAYLRAVVQGTAIIGLVIDGTANNNCPATSMPVVEYCVDQGPFTVVPLTKTGEQYVLPLADQLDPAAPHRVEVYFRAADLCQKRWTSSMAHLRIAGLEVAAGGILLECPRRPKRAICFGDSITEGVGVDGLFTSWQSLSVNNARGSWCPIVCAALECEYGQLGSGGQGIVNEKMALPPLPRSWDRYDAETSRLTDGRLVPEPDYIFCAMGTNDYEPEMQKAFPAAFLGWLVAVRASCPNARIFCIAPPLGTNSQAVAEAIATRQRDGDTKVHLIDTARLQDAFAAGRPTQLALDGVHPTMYGNAVLSALIVAQVERILSREAILR